MLIYHILKYIVIILYGRFVSSPFIYFLIICLYQHGLMDSIFTLDYNPILFNFIVQIVLAFGHWDLFMWLLYSF